MHISLTATLTANEITRQIKEKREEYDRLYPLAGRAWYIATGQSIKEFDAQYPFNCMYEFHHLIQSKSLLDEVLTAVLKADKMSAAEIGRFLGGKEAPVYLFNYCFNFKQR